MIYTIAHLFRKNSLSRSEFSEYYETRHTRLAQRVLPEFSYYRRNHVIESTDDTQCPDSFSEFGYDQASELSETLSILSDARGGELLDDELQFMNKTRNQVYPVTPFIRVTRQGAPKQQPFSYKIIAVMRGFVGGVEAWLTAWQNIDPALQNTMAYSAIDNDNAQRLHWLMGWGSQLPTLALVQNQLIAKSVPVLWCARVDERSGYPK